MAPATSRRSGAHALGRCVCVCADHYIYLLSQNSTMTKQETKPTTTITTTSSSSDESSSGGGPGKVGGGGGSGGGGGGGAHKHVPLAIRAPPPPYLSPPAVTAMTVSAAPTASTAAAAAAQPLLQDFPPRGMVHDVMAELVVTTTGYMWDIDALILLQAAAEDFLNGCTEVEL
ncbi:hypothetical protein DFP73DRAFT_602450 [Morchella snyderi]|nr:hypothetical protein DFP73DRAFT_602450 [Morchella snyderi]